MLFWKYPCYWNHRKLQSNTLHPDHPARVIRRHGSGARSDHRALALDRWWRRGRLSDVRGLASSERVRIGGRRHHVNLIILSSRRIGCRQNWGRDRAPRPAFNMRDIISRDIRGRFHRRSSWVNASTSSSCSPAKSRPVCLPSHG